MRKLRVYIAGPISKGDMLHNVRQADAAFFALMRAGLAPWNPMLTVFAGSACVYSWDMKGKPVVNAIADSMPNSTTHADWMGVDLPWVEVSDAVLRLPGESVGADAEVRHANANGIPVFATVEQVISWAAQKAAA